MILKSGSINVSPAIKRLILIAVAVGAVLVVYFAASAVITERGLL